jgi:hypothetical protein
LGNLNPNVLQQLNEIIDIPDVGDVVDGHRLVSEQCGTDYLERFVLGTLWGDGSAKQMSAFYFE